MNLLNTFAKDLLGGEAGSAGGSGEHGLGGMDKLMSEFQNFLKDNEGNEDMNSALNSVFKEFLNKDILYQPMAILRDEFPIWLEENWQKIS